MDSDGAGPSGGMGGGGGNYEFGVDPSMDPELAMALRMSLEEEQARQRAAEGASGGGAATELPAVPEANEETSTLASAPQGGNTSARLDPTTGQPIGPSFLRQLRHQGVAEPMPGQGSDDVDESEEAMLQQALALSKGGESTNDEDVEMGDEEGDEEDMDEEEAIARAIEMSLKGEQDQQKK